MLEIKGVTTKKDKEGKANFEKFDFFMPTGEFLSMACKNHIEANEIAKLIVGTQKIVSGKILLNSNDITKLSPKEHAEKIVHIKRSTSLNTQKTLLENMTIAEHGLLFGLFTLKASENKKEYYRDLLTAARLGLENRLDDKISSLSPLEQLCAELVIKTVKAPELTVLECPTKLLDSKSAFVFLEFCDRIIFDKKLTAIMITDNIRDAVEYASRLATLRNGRIVSDIKGRKKIMLTFEKYAKLWGEIFA